MTFSISAMPCIGAMLPKGAFPMLTQFYHLWPPGQQNVVQIFDRRSGCKMSKQNLPGGVTLTPCISTIFNHVNAILTFVLGCMLMATIGLNDREARDKMFTTAEVQ